MTLPESTLRLGVPSGSMQTSTIELFGRAGYKISVDGRSVFPRVDDDKISAVLFRSQEISRYVVEVGVGWWWQIGMGGEQLLPVDRATTGQQHQQDQAGGQGRASRHGSASEEVSAYGGPTLAEYVPQPRPGSRVTETADPIRYR